MCVGVCYLKENKTIITHFAQAKALLPIKTKNKEIKLLPWGRRTGEHSQLPLGGWAALESVQSGKWDFYRPKPVKIVVTKFMEEDFEGRSLWFDVTAGYWLQGLLIQEALEQRVYIVTLENDLPKTPYPRWPRILCD